MFVIVHDTVLEIIAIGKIHKSLIILSFVNKITCIRGPLSSYCTVLPEYTAYLKEPFFLKLFAESEAYFLALVKDYDLINRETPSVSGHRNTYLIFFHQPADEVISGN